MKTGYGFGISVVILIAVNSDDPASVGIAEALLSNSGWSEGVEVEGMKTHQREGVRLWWLLGEILWQDDLDKRWNQATREVVEEVIFPSRHRAVSGMPSLTLHPIGVPHILTQEEVEYGGRAGKAAPASPRLADWFRKLSAMAEEVGLDEEFEVSLEVTHHGPWVSVPALFVEIGSDESQWGDKQAAALLGELIWWGLGLAESVEMLSSNCSESRKLVMVGFGGGHYAPRHGDLLLGHQELSCGHILANHSLQFSQEDSENPWEQIGGTWRAAVEEAVASTRLSHPKHFVFAYLDKKSFKGWQRRALKDLLGSLEVPVYRTKNLKEHLGRLEI